MPEAITAGTPIRRIAWALNPGNGPRKIKKLQRCGFVPSIPKVVVDVLRCGQATSCQIGKEIFPVAICGDLRGAGIDRLRECGSRAEIVLSGLRVSQIDWLGEIALLKKMSSQSSDIRRLNDETLTNVSLDRKVKSIRIGCIDLAINTRSDCERIW